MTRTILALTATLLSAPAFAGVGALLGTFSGEVEHVRNGDVRVTPVEFEIYDSGNLYFVDAQAYGFWSDLGRMDAGLRSMIIETEHFQVEGVFDRQTGCFEGTGIKYSDDSSFVMNACKVELQF